MERGRANGSEALGREHTNDDVGTTAKCDDQEATPTKVNATEVITSSYQGLVSTIPTAWNPKSSDLAVRIHQ